jgi:hypothetical protein
MFLITVTLEQQRQIHSGLDDFAAQFLVNHLFIRVIRVIRGLIIFLKV